MIDRHREVAFRGIKFSAAGRDRFGVMAPHANGYGIVPFSVPKVNRHGNVFKPETPGTNIEMQFPLDALGTLSKCLTIRFQKNPFHLGLPEKY